MALNVIELNDAGVRIGNEAQHLAESPGYALLQGDRLLLGMQARSEARLHPRHTHTQFWSRLSTDTLPQPGPRARTVADLAYAHLLDLWSLATSSPDGGTDEVVFAVPGQFDRNQLALLLGIARECPFKSVGLVDLAVAAVAADGSSPGAVLHVSGQLHRTVITRVTAGDELQRDRVDDTAATSLLGLQDTMVGLIADAFIRETRFDPLHEASSEQRLYDNLGGWLIQLQRDGEAMLELDTGRNSFRVNLHHDALVERLRPRYEQLTERLRLLSQGQTVIRLDARMAALPGLVRTLNGLLEEPSVELETDDAVRRGTLACLAEVRREGERLAFVTRLPNRRGHQTLKSADSSSPPRPAEPARPPSEAPTAATTRPTHLLLGHEAWPLRSAVLTIGGPAGEGTLALPGTSEPVCTIRVQELGIRLDPEVNAQILQDGVTVERAVHLAPGDEVLINERIRLTPIVVHPGA
ncbi:MAG: hypothetical protein EA417_08820 [Gammaproteobacteria bacterium]|nr:MAG: hypothetical protein EA417_08820 [Gammaproteobacteria bacterium]